ncbi:MAG: hypothetical protein ACP5XB_13715 [Isosphaeraceae bacterium]
MLRHVAFCTVALLAAAGGAVCASPITFDFTGTGGVSGSFTINGDPTVPPGASLTGSPSNTTLLTEGGTDVSLTVNPGQGLGWQVFTYSNSPSNPWGAQAFLSSGYPGPGNTTLALLTILGQASDPDGHYQQFRLGLLVPTDEASLANLRTFGLPLINPSQPWASSTWAYSTDSSLHASGSGTLTSVQLVSTPEPGSIVVFSTLAVAALLQARRSRRRGPGKHRDFPDAACDG